MIYGLFFCRPTFLLHLSFSLIFCLESRFLLRTIIQKRYIRIFQIFAFMDRFMDNSFIFLMLNVCFTIPFHLFTSVSHHPFPFSICHRHLSLVPVFLHGYILCGLSCWTPEIKVVFERIWEREFSNNFTVRLSKLSSTLYGPHCSIARVSQFAGSTFGSRIRFWSSQGSLTLLAMSSLWLL